MNTKIFVSQSTSFSSIINLLKTKDVDFEEFNGLDISNVNNFSLFFIDFNKIKEKELNLLKEFNCCEKVNFLIN